MTLPAYALGLLYALLLGSLFHVVRNGGAFRLLLYLALSILGAAVGQWFGTWRGWVFFPVGPLNLGFVTIGSILFLVVGSWLSQVEIARGDHEGREV